MQLYRRFFEESNEGFGEDGEPIPVGRAPSIKVRLGLLAMCQIAWQRDQLEAFVRAFGKCLLYGI